MLSPPPPTTAPWFDTTRTGVGRSSMLAHRQDSQPVTRGGIEVAKHVEPGRSRPPEQRDQAPSIEGKLAAVEDDEAGAGLSGPRGPVSGAGRAPRGSAPP